MPQKRILRRRLYITIVAVAILLNFAMDLRGLYEGVRLDVLIGISVDLILIALLGFLFWFEQRARARTEQALKRTIEHLDATNNLLLRSNAQKTRILRSTIHDLKNPLGSIRGFAELLHDEPLSRDSVLEMSETIRRISDNTLDLVNTLMNEKALERGHISLNKKAMDVIPLIQEYCDRLKILAEEKDQKLDVSLHTDHLQCEVDSLRIGDVINNIAGNAIKFSPPGSFIKIKSQIVNNRMQLIVDDQGPGFTDADKLKAFQPGQILSAKPTGGEVSTGMGLFSAKQNMDLHNGTVTIADNPHGSGTRFIIEWPMRTT